MVKGKISGGKKFKELGFQDLGRIRSVYIETAKLKRGILLQSDSDPGAHVRGNDPKSQ